MSLKARAEMGLLATLDQPRMSSATQGPQAKISVPPAGEPLSPVMCCCSYNRHRSPAFMRPFVCLHQNHTTNPSSTVERATVA